MSESARISRLLERQRMLACAAAIQGARAACHCDLSGNSIVNPRIATIPCCDTSSPDVVFVCGTGDIYSETLTVSSVLSGAITVGMAFTYSGVLNTIVAFGTGTGGAGTYAITFQSIPDGSTITSTNNNAAVPLPNSYIEAEKADVGVWGSLVFPGAVAIRGTTVSSESARIKVKLDKYAFPANLGGQPLCGYNPPGIPFIAPGCPPTPTAILNSSLPKPSTKIVCPVTRFEGVITNCS